MAEEITIAVVGASGFVGQRIMTYLLEHTNHQVRAISRNPISSHYETHPKYTWISADLHNLLSIERALVDVRVAIYLVHSMLPSARLNQGTFRDFDLSLADNFGRAARYAGVEQVIYLGGLIPDAEELSPHLQSRKEVEVVLKSYIPKLTTIRAGLIIGEQGSSFTIMVRLVQRLPFMICPIWTKSVCQPIYIDDVVRSLSYCINRPESFGKTYDVGSQDRLSYLDMMKKTASYLARSPKFFVLPAFSPRLSRLWVTLVTGAPKSLAYPLIESLKDDMLVRADYQLGLPGGPVKSFEEMLNLVMKQLRNPLSPIDRPHAFKRTFTGQKQKSVRSIQRLPLPQGKTAEWVACRYMNWLPLFFPFFLSVEINDQFIFFRLKGFKANLLVLRYSPERSQKDRQLFYIKGGILSSRRNIRGRLEIRETLGGSAIIAAVHDFIPSLPWYLYRLTQAKIHAYVMYRFQQFLRHEHQKSRSSFIY